MPTLTPPPHQVTRLREGKQQGREGHTGSSCWAGREILLQHGREEAMKETNPPPRRWATCHKAIICKSNAPYPIIYGVFIHDETHDSSSCDGATTLPAATHNRQRAECRVVHELMNTIPPTIRDADGAEQRNKGVLHAFLTRLLQEYGVWGTAVT